MREDGDPVQPEAAFGQFQVGRLKRISRRGVLQVEVTAQKEVSGRIVWGRGRKSGQGWGPIVGRSIKGTHRKTQRIGFGTLRHVDFQVPPRKHFTYLVDYPRVGYE